MASPEEKKIGKVWVYSPQRGRVPQREEQACQWPPNPFEQRDQFWLAGCQGRAGVGGANQAERGARVEQVWGPGGTIGQTAVCQGTSLSATHTRLPLASQSLLFVSLEPDWCGLMARPASGEKEEALG